MTKVRVKGKQGVALFASEKDASTLCTRGWRLAPLSIETVRASASRKPGARVEDDLAAQRPKSYSSRPLAAPFLGDDGDLSLGVGRLVGLPGSPSSCTSS